LKPLIREIKQKSKGHLNMSRNVEVYKSEQEDENFVYYIYQFTLRGEEYKSASGKTRYKLKLVSGKLKIDKKNGDVHTLELAEGDNGSYARCASWALMRHWKKGEYPEKTFWES
jgi:hypothetical protein